MARLSVSKFIIPKSNTEMTLIYYNDYSIPQGVSCFFRRDPRFLDKAKVRIKLRDKYASLSSSTRSSISEAMHKLAKQYDYSFERLLDVAKGRQY